MKIFEGLASHPEFWYHEANVALSQRALGNFYRATDRRTEAAVAYREALRILEKHIAQSPTVRWLRFDCGRTYGELGQLVLEQGHAHEALGLFTRSVDQLEIVLQKEKNNGGAREALAESHAGRAHVLTRLSRHAEALKDWDRAIVLDDKKTQNRLSRALTLAHLGDHGRATTEAAKVANETPPAGENLYGSACVYSLASAKARGDAKLASQEREFLEKTYVGAAVDLLRKARAAGYFEETARIDHMKEDSNLDPLRMREDFKKLVMALEAGSKK